MENFIEIIACIEDLDRFLQAKDKKFTKHVKRDRWAIDSYNFQQLKAECPALVKYVENNCQYVPDLYGCGLLSRSIRNAVSKGAILMPEFYQNLGFDKREANELIATDYQWH